MAAGSSTTDGLSVRSVLQLALLRCSPGSLEEKAETALRAYLYCGEPNLLPLGRGS